MKNRQKRIRQTSTRAFNGANDDDDNHHDNHHELLLVSLHHGGSVSNINVMLVSIQCLAVVLSIVAALGVTHCKTNATENANVTTGLEDYRRDAGQRRHVVFHPQLSSRTRRNAQSIISRHDDGENHEETEQVQDEPRRPSADRRLRRG